MPDLSNVPTEELLKMREQAAQKPAISEVPTEQLLQMRRQALETKRPKTSVGESALRGAAQGATLGWADELTAGVGAIKDAGAAALGLRGDISLKDAYNSYLPHIRAADDAAKADNPKTFIGGSIAGGIGTSLAMPGSLAAGANTIKGATVMGGITGAGTSEANPFESPDKLKEFGGDVGKGALVGFVTGAAAKAAGKAFNALKPSELEKTANIKALKAAGYTGPELKKMSQAEIQELGSTLHKTGTVKAFDSLDDVLTKATAGKEQAGKAIGEALDGVDDLVAQAKGAVDAGKLDDALLGAGKGALTDPARVTQAREAFKAQIDKQFQFNMERIGDRIEQELIAPNARNPLLKGELGKLQAIAEDFKAGGTASLREGNIIKGTQGKVTNFNSETVPQAFKQEVYGIIKTELDDIVAKTGNLESAVSKAGGGGGFNPAARNASVSEAYQTAKQNYGALKRTAEVAERRLGQTQGQREISLTDYIAGGAALAGGGPAAAVAAGGLNKLARQYGDSAMSATARRAAQIIAKSPEKLGSFATMLEEAAQKGAPALNATHVSLMKNPDYQRILADYESREPSPIKRRIMRMGE